MGDLKFSLLALFCSDDEPPSFNICPADVINSTDASLNTSVIYWQEPTITDNVGVATNDSSHKPGDVFPVGRTKVTYSVSDGAGNTNNCSFVVTVEGEFTCFDTPVFTS